MGLPTTIVSLRIPKLRTTKESDSQSAGSYSSVDWDRMVADVQKWERRNRSPHSPAVDPMTPSLLIIEGIFILNCKPLFDLMDHRIFLTLDHNTLKERRCTRAYDPPDPPGYFEKYVWPAYEKSLNEVKMEEDRITFVNANEATPDELFTFIYGRLNFDKLK
ncbi:unnamed protein product [Calicophoron daubneyi]|uniref:Nicotinamide riboside kinase 1 n=1 Tax=Calicophoron daubneyi TaxID=300641 RepID=A0AAV2TR77_CALDB